MRITMNLFDIIVLVFAVCGCVYLKYLKFRSLNPKGHKVRTVGIVVKNESPAMQEERG